MNKYNIFSFNLHKFFVNFLQTPLLLLRHPFLFYFFQEFQENFYIYLQTLRNLTKVQEMKRNKLQKHRKGCFNHFWLFPDISFTFMIFQKLLDFSQTSWFCHKLCDNEKIHANLKKIFNMPKLFLKIKILLNNNMRFFIVSLLELIRKLRYLEIWEI